MVYTERIYYTLNELQPDEDGIAQTFSSLFSYWGLTFTDTTKTINLYNHIAEQYGEDYCVYIDVKRYAGEYFEIPTIEDIFEDYDLKKQVVKFLNKIKNWIGDSLERYDTLIDLYENNKNNLMNKVQTISKNKFNDTPQTTTSGLDSDDYATTYTTNTLESDNATVISRLNEIRALWESLYSEWTAEFAKKFVLY